MSFNRDSRKQRGHSPTLNARSKAQKLAQQPHPDHDADFHGHPLPQHLLANMTFQQAMDFCHSQLHQHELQLSDCSPDERQKQLDHARYQCHIFMEENYPRDYSDDFVPKNGFNSFDSNPESGPTGQNWGPHEDNADASGSDTGYHQNEYAQMAHFQMYQQMNMQNALAQMQMQQASPSFQTQQMGN